MAARSRHLPALRSAHGNGLLRSRLKLHQSHNGGVREEVPVHAPGRVASARAGVLPRKRCGGGGGGPGAQPLRGASAAPPETGFRAAALFSQACHGVQEFWSRQMQQHILGEDNRAGLSLHVLWPAVCQCIPSPRPACAPLPPLVRHKSSRRQGASSILRE